MEQLPKIFPDLELRELGADHPVFKEPYAFPDGLPKIHEHDGDPAQVSAPVAGRAARAPPERDRVGPAQTRIVASASPIPTTPISVAVPGESGSVAVRSGG